MSGYTKLFGSILGSTIWREDSDTRIVWITMLALADADGIVEASVPGLAHFACVSTETAQSAIAKFLAPDPDSRSPEYEGRRIEKVEGGWLLLNYEKYMYKLSVDDRKERDRLRQQRRRARLKAKCDSHALSPLSRDSHGASPNVTQGPPNPTQDETIQDKTENFPTPHLSKPELHRTPHDDPGFNPGNDGQQVFNAFVDLFPLGRRDYDSQPAQAAYFSTIGEIRKERDCTDPEAVEWLNGKFREYLAGLESPRFCKSVLNFLRLHPWKDAEPKPRKLVMMESDEEAAKRVRAEAWVRMEARQKEKAGA